MLRPRARKATSSSFLVKKNKTLVRSFDFSSVHTYKRDPNYRPVDKKSLIQFLSNKCSYLECESIARVLENDEQELDQLEIFENLSEDQLIKVSDQEKEAMLQAMFPRKKRIALGIKILVAAAVLVFGLFSLLKIHQQKTTDNPDAAVWVNLENTDSISSRWFLLPDSSRIRLEPKARVRYRSSFAKDRKIHQSSGEVTYFVQQDTLHPFRVINQGIETEALGTIFTVGDYDEHNLLIQLVEGRIAIGRGQADLSDRVLLENQSALIVNKANLTFRLLQEEAQSHAQAWKEEQDQHEPAVYAGAIAWSNRMVNFNGVSNADLFTIMERLFGITIDVENPEITNGNFTGQLYQNDNLENLLTIFCEINGCTFTIQDKVIKIR